MSVVVDFVVDGAADLLSRLEVKGMGWGSGRVMVGERMEMRI